MLNSNTIYFLSSLVFTKLLWYNYNMQKLISQDPEILGGKPIITGTRMSVEVILESLAGGMETKDILKEYPFLKKEQVQATVDYATKLLSKLENQKEEILNQSLTIIQEKKADSYPFL